MNEKVAEMLSDQILKQASNDDLTYHMRPRGYEDFGKDEYLDLVKKERRDIIGGTVGGALAGMALVPIAYMATHNPAAASSIARKFDKKNIIQMVPKKPLKAKAEDMALLVPNAFRPANNFDKVKMFGGKVKDNAKALKEGMREMVTDVESQGLLPILGLNGAMYGVIGGSGLAAVHDHNAKRNHDKEKQAGYEAFYSLMEKHAADEADSGNGLKDGTKALISLVPYALSIPYALKSSTPFGARLGALGGSMYLGNQIADAANEFTKAYRDSDDDDANQAKQAGHDAFYSLMEKEAIAPIIGAGISAAKSLVPKMIGGAKNIGNLAKAQKNLMAAKHTVNKSPGMSGAGDKLISNFTKKRDVAFNTAKPALQNVGLVGSGMIAGSAFGGNDNVKQASDQLIDSMIQKQAAVETMAESKIIAESSEKALNSLGYSMFA